MSCINSQCYLPQPTRAWSRVQRSCSQENDTNTNTNINYNPLVRVPYTNKLVPASNLGYEIAMINKGNVLQYKINSSNLTKNQRYSKIAKGQWTNRTKTWATQNDKGYTNPNIHSLLRVGGENVTLAGVPTNLPVTCFPNLIPIYNILPSQISGSSQDQTIPPPVPPTPGSEVIVPLVIEAIVEPIVIQDFGNLVCGTKENVCTGEIIRPVQLDNCHPTTDSDVPGPIEDLCWNDGNPTWYPRQQYVMTNSTNKWPVNYKVLTSAIRPATPILTVIVTTVYTLSWITTTTCLPITSYNIFQNNLIIANTTENNYTVPLNGLTNSFYIVALNNNIQSIASNVVSV
jgi:hypothetical protein